MCLSSIFSSDMFASRPSPIISFVVRILIFALPLFFVVAVLEGVLWHTGDSVPVRQILIQQQQQADTLYGRSYFSQQFNVYKIAAMRLRKPTILVLGSSRVMQFRSLMFAPLEQQFYNAGGMLQNAFDLRAFSNLIVEGELPVPRVLIVGIDPWWIKKGYGESSWLADPDEAYSLTAHISVMRRILRSGSRLGELISDAQLPVRTPSGHLGIGSLARRNSSGFRADGSKHPPLKIFSDYAKKPGYVDRESPPVIQRIIRHSSPFTLPAVVDEERIGLIVDSLKSLKGHGMEVYAFLPPVSTEALAALVRDSEMAEWWRYYHENLPQLLKRQGIEVISIPCSTDLGLDDRYMLDGFHPGEVFIARVTERLSALAPSSSPLKGVDLTRLGQRVNNAAMPLALEMP
jgi:hypothetical protein